MDERCPDGCPHLRLLHGPRGCVGYVQKGWRRDGRALIVDCGCTATTEPPQMFYRSRVDRERAFVVASA